MQNDPQSLAASSNSVEVSQSQGLPVADNNGGSGSAPMQVSAVVAPSSPTSHGLSANATLGRIIQSGPAVPMLPFLPGGAMYALSCSFFELEVHLIQIVCCASPIAFLPTSPTLDHAIHDYLVKRGLTMLAHQFLQHISLVPTAPAPNSMLGSVWKFWQNHAVSLDSMFRNAFVPSDLFILADFCCCGWWRQSTVLDHSGQGLHGQAQCFHGFRSHVVTQL